MIWQSGSAKFCLTPVYLLAITEVAEMVGMTVGTAGLVMGLTKYLRGKPKITVVLHWNMCEVDTGIRFRMAPVTNIGRLPICIGAAVMTVPKGFGKHSHFSFMSRYLARSLRTRRSDADQDQSRQYG